MKPGNTFAVIAINCVNKAFVCCYVVLAREGYLYRQLVLCKGPYDTKTEAARKIPRGYPREPGYEVNTL